MWILCNNYGKKLAIAIRSEHFPQMCLLGLFGVLCATMRIDSVKKGSKTTHFVSYRVTATEK